jgi:hypothetical protein
VSCYILAHSWLQASPGHACNGNTCCFNCRTCITYLKSTCFSTFVLFSLLIMTLSRFSTLKQNGRFNNFTSSTSRKVTETCCLAPFLNPCTSTSYFKKKYLLRSLLYSTNESGISIISTKRYVSNHFFSSKMVIYIFSNNVWTSSQNFLPVLQNRNTRNFHVNAKSSIRNEISFRFEKVRLT